MTTVEIAALLFVGGVGFASAVGAYLWVRNRIRLAEELLANGWVCIGCNFITGPVMIPPLQNPNCVPHETAPKGAP
jgi:hypothetical protein